MSNIVIPSWAESWKLLNIINWTHNIVLPADAKLPPDLVKQVELFKSIVWQTLTLSELQWELQEIYWKWKNIILPSWRFATVLWWEWTNLHRKADKIILPGTSDDFPIHNMWGNVVDPVWWASRAAAPNDEYWLLWKVAELRPSSDKFNKELHRELSNTPIKVSSILWHAVEVSEDEVALMPVVALEWWEDIISEFSEKSEVWDTPTAKHFILNR